MSRIDEDCQKNIAALIQEGKQIAATWNVLWESPVWEVSHIFAVSRRSHRSERKSLNFWFTERGEIPKVPGRPFETKFGEIVRSFVVLRHQFGNQCFVDQQQIIFAAQFISQQLVGRNHDLTKLTSGDLEAACDHIAATQAKSTAYKLHRFIEEIAATINKNRLCPRRLNFRYARKSRPEAVGGIDYARLDDPDLARGESAKLIPQAVLKAIGHLYQTIPSTQTTDRLLIDAVVIAVCTGRRIGEILTLPVQKIGYDRSGHAYLLYYKEKRSRGCQIVLLEKMYLIPQTVPLLEAAISEAITLTTECRSVAKTIANTGHAYTVGLVDTPYLTSKDLQSFLGLSKDSTNTWLRNRKINFAPGDGHRKRYKRTDIVSAMSLEIFRGPAVHVTPPSKDLEIEDAIFVAFKHAFHARKATFKYAVFPVNVQNFGDFLGARGLGVFRRYFHESEESTYRVNSHRFRHTLNTILQRGGMSDALQTEWFARKNPNDTKAYQHMTPAEKAYSAHLATATRFDDPLPPLKVSTREEAIVAADQRAVLDLGLGYCHHDWRNRPCARYAETPLDQDSLFWEAFEPSDRATELDRMQQFIEVMQERAQHRADCGEQEAIQWVDLYRKKLAEIKQLKLSL